MDILPIAIFFAGFNVNFIFHCNARSIVKRTPTEFITSFT